MGDFFANLSPNARKALMIGVPVVALYVLVTSRNRPAAPPAEENPADASGTIPAVQLTDAAIGTGEITDNFNKIWEQLADITGSLKDQEKTITTPPKLAPRAQGGRAPVTANNKPDPMLGKRTTSVIKVPAGTPETIGDVSRRVYTSANWWKHLVYVNADRFPKGAGPNTRLQVGQAVRY